uniref:Integrase catalytic domain-containing protein n=1 Tax=Tanacetum cinerariifolium TaxID=118510 RepID=A0A6L2M369_TANCI|nr:hypothetical protein [Tanacetum cinerariifolium]
MDHGKKIDNEVQFGAFCDANGITHNFSAPRTPQLDMVIERKNRTLQEMSRTMLNEQSIPQEFWCNTVNISTYILNRILIRPFLGKTPYEIFKGKKPSLEYFKVFGSKCFILNTKNYLTKFDPKSTEGIFLGYSPNSKAYIFLNKETVRVEESLNMKFDESPPPKSSPLVDDDILKNEIIENQEKDLEIKENEPLSKEIVNINEIQDHPTCSVIDNTLYTKKKDLHIIIVQIYMDDIIFRSTCQDLCDDFLKIMHDELKMRVMGELNFFFGLQIKQLKDDIFFNQSKYIKEMLKKFGLKDSKPIKTPMSSETKLTRDEGGESVDDTKSCGMIGSLLYLTASRSNVMFSVCLCARFQEALKTSHLEVVKRIFRYIKRTTHLGLWYPKGTRIETIVYADSDHAGDYVDRKSISGVCTFMGCCLTSRFSKKQIALAISITEAKYVSARKVFQQALWMKQALVNYNIFLDDIPVLYDNKGAIDLSKNHVFRSRTKHIEIRHHFLRDNVQKGEHLN